MKGARPFANQTEINRFLGAIKGRYAVRDRAIAALGLKTGGRIGQLLALRVGDIFRDGRFVARIYFRRQTRKGQIEGQSLPFHPSLKAPLGRWLAELRRLRGGRLNPRDFIFASRKGGGTRPIGRKAFWGIMARSARLARLAPGTSTHTFRKTVAWRVYEKSGHCLLTVGRVLGHRSVATTAAYLGWGLDRKADRAVRGL